MALSDRRRVHDLRQATAGEWVRSRKLAGAAGCLLATMVWTAALRAAGSEGASDSAPSFPPVPEVYPATREFHWTMRVPVLTTEQREFVFRAPTGFTRPQRWDYEGPAVRTERRRVAIYPDFSCLYLDPTVSNECRTVWRGIYADLPVIVTRPQHLVFDLPDWRWKAQLVPIAVARLTWKDERWTVSIPAIGVDDAGHARIGAETSAGLAQARSTLAAKQASALAVLDQGLHTIEHSIAVAEAQGGDPRRIETDEGKTLDLVATRDAWRDERAATVRRFQRVATDLDAVAAQSPPGAE